MLKINKIVREITKYYPEFFLCDSLLLQHLILSINPWDFTIRQINHFVEISILILMQVLSLVHFYTLDPLTSFPYVIFNRVHPKNFIILLKKITIKKKTNK